MQRLRYGSATLLSVDDGDGDLYNASQLLDVDKQEGAVSMTCASRVIAHRCRLQSTVHCGARPACSRVWSEAVWLRRPAPTCPVGSCCPASKPGGPTTKVSLGKTQGLHSRDLEKESRRCRCGEGRVLSRSRLTYEDEDECAWQPCLSCGSYFNTQPGDVSWMQRVNGATTGHGGKVVLLPGGVLNRQHPPPAPKGPPTSLKGAPWGLLVPHLVGAVPSACGRAAGEGNHPVSSGEEVNVEGGRVSPPPSRGSECWGAAGGRGSKGGLGSTPPAGDDLRNYAYEGDGSSPGSLSSCKC
ncbi:Neural-cadherin [Chionoecetes opilio]|uniref:Neural-cadherin n=1 Tax=Chionoecetes opilio TaxID=41210 RepID=A0A8J4Y8J2_CHIOP|nr:Neural-cadherin [Chionoecetes opilio]